MEEWERGGGGGEGWNWREMGNVFLCFWKSVSCMMAMTKSGDQWEGQSAGGGRTFVSRAKVIPMHSPRAP